MSDNQRPDSGSSRYLRYTAVGLEFFSPIIGGMVAGYYLGEYLHMPLLGLVGLIGGVFLGFYRLVIEIRDFMKNA